MDVIFDIIKNIGIPAGLLCYFMYKDNKFTETITKALTSIDDSLEIIRETVVKNGRSEKK